MGSQRPLKIIIDFDGTLTAEEQQVSVLAQKSLHTLAREILKVPEDQLIQRYQATKDRLLSQPHLYYWEVNGLVASYCDEGAFILNTSTLQAMLREDEAYAAAVATAFPRAEYDPIVDCTNYLFHRHTAEIPPLFRPSAAGVLASLAEHPYRTPIILTNSLADKVHRHLATLGSLGEELAVLGDTRQYDMDPDWTHHFVLEDAEGVQIWPVDELHQIDLRRPAYYRALMQEGAGGSQLAVVADTLSLPGALPLMMSIPFFLLHTPYTPAWCAAAVDAHPLGHVLEDLSGLVVALDGLD